MTTTTKTIRLTDPQLTALDTAGIFDCPDEEHEPLVAAIKGDRLTVTDPEAFARIVCDLSNHADALAQEFNDDRAAMYAKDSRVLCNLMCKIRRA